MEEVKKDQEKKSVDPLEYFSRLKGLKNETNKEAAEKLKEISSTLLKKAIALGQRFMIEKLDFMIKCYTRELKVLDAGITTYITKDDILEFIDKIDKEVVKIIELEKYPREIPNDIAERILELKEQGVFDQLFVLFTDYTGEVERQVEEEKRRKDPILLGTFLKKKRPSSVDDYFDRFYFIADWEDEYCDLTLDKFLQKMKDKKVYSISIPVTDEQVAKALASIQEDDSKVGVFFNESILASNEKPHFFKRIRTLFKRKK